MVSIKIRRKISLVTSIVIVSILIRIFVCEIYYVPSGSMENTFYAGDYILVSKLHYGARVPRSILDVPLFNSLYLLFSSNGLVKLNIVDTSLYSRTPGFEEVHNNDIAVLNKGNIYSKYIVKRIVGVPCDTVEFINGEVFINKEKKQEVDNVKYSYSIKDRINTDTTILMKDVLNKLKISYKEHRHEKNKEWKTILLTNKQKNMLLSLGYGNSSLLKKSNRDNYKIYIMNCGCVSKEEGEIYLLGDNRDFSMDSRIYGKLNYNEIVGKPLFVLFSIDPHKSFISGFRMNRFLKNIK